MIELLDQRVSQGAVVTSARGPLPASVDDWREALRRHDWMRDVDRLLRQPRERVGLQNTVPGSGYVVNTGSSAISLTGATAKTIIYINAGANDAVHLVEFSVGFDGVSSSAVPALVELCLGTKASNSTPGTGSTSFTPVQLRGWPVQTAAAAAANSCSSEPTVLVSHKQWLVTPNGGLLVVQAPLGREPTGHNIASTSGLQVAIRVTAPATVNVRGYTEHEE